MGRWGPQKSLDERFWPKVRMTDTCWLWMGARHVLGYGHLAIYEGPRRYRYVPAHRVAYEQLVGSIPAGWHLDHLCRNPPCVRPEHLEAVTPRENNLRGMGWSGRNARKTECRKGHPYTEENTLRDKLGKRYCRECNRIQCADYKQRTNPATTIAPAKRTHCPKGHPYDEVNTRRSPRGRHCRACRQAYDRKRRSVLAHCAEGKSMIAAKGAQEPVRTLLSDARKAQKDSGLVRY